MLHLRPYPLLCLYKLLLFTPWVLLIFDQLVLNSLQPEIIQHLSNPGTIGSKFQHLEFVASSKDLKCYLQLADLQKGYDATLNCAALAKDNYDITLNCTTLAEGNYDTAQFCAAPAVGNKDTAQCCTAPAVGNKDTAQCCAAPAVGNKNNVQCCAAPAVGNKYIVLCCAAPAVGNKDNALCCAAPAVGNKNNALCCTALALGCCNVLYYCAIQEVDYFTMLSATISNIVTQVFCSVSIILHRLKIISINYGMWASLQLAGCGTSLMHLPTLINHVILRHMQQL